MSNKRAPAVLLLSALFIFALQPLSASAAIPEGTIQGNVQSNIAIGNWSHAGINNGHTATEGGNTAVGFAARAQGVANDQGLTEGWATAVGYAALAQNNLSSAVGALATALGSHATSFGALATASGNYGTAVGLQATATGQNSSAFGTLARAAEKNSSAFGFYAQALGEDSVALGQSSRALEANTVSVGNVTLKRRIVNVADGINDNDAVNVSQLNATNQSITGLGTDIAGLGARVAQNETDIAGLGTSVSDLGARVTQNETDIAGLGARVAQNETDIAGLGARVAQNETDIAGLGADVSALDGRVTQAEDDISAIEASIRNAVQYDGGAKDKLTLAGGEGTVISNVADGVDAADAVNKRQLDAAVTEYTTSIENHEREFRFLQSVLGEGYSNPTFSSLRVGGIRSDGVNLHMGGGTITGLADGGIYRGSSDAVTGNQLWQAYRRMDDLNKSINIVGAHTAALSGLNPIPYNPYEPTTLSAAVGIYRDEYAVAVGVSHYVRENVLFNMGASICSDGDVMARAGISLAVGMGGKKKPELARDMAGMQQQMIAMQAKLEELAARDEAKDAAIKRLEKENAKLQKQLNVT